MRGDLAKQLTVDEPWFAANAEIGLQLALLGENVREVPISWINRTFDMGQSSFKVLKSGGGYARVLWRFALATRFGHRRLVAAKVGGECARPGGARRRPAARPVYFSSNAARTASQPSRSGAQISPLYNIRGVVRPPIEPRRIPAGLAMQQPARRVIPRIQPVIEQEVPMARRRHAIRMRRASVIPARRQPRQSRANLRTAAAPA